MLSKSKRVSPFHDLRGLKDTTGHIWDLGPSLEAWVGVESMGHGGGGRQKDDERVVGE